MARDLPFEHIKGIPFDPRGRGKIERFFETVNTLFLARQPGYAPEGHGGTAPSLTVAEVQRRFHDWLLAEYMQRVHTETDCTPFE